MTDAPGSPEPGFTERMRAARAAMASGPPAGSLVAWSGWGFVICAAVAIGYGLWTLYGSGARVALLDLSAGNPGASTTAPEGPGGTPGALGPIRLEPEMNPVRAVLRAAYAPVGSTRIRYEVAIVDAAERRVLEKRGAFGSSDDDASIVKTTASLGVFRLERTGEFFVRARMSGASMDDLRAASLELRRNVTPVDVRIPWGFGLAALACLIVNLVASRRGAWPCRIEANERRPAA